MGGEKITLIQFAKLNEAIEQSSGSTLKIATLKRAWPTFSDKETLVKILCLELPPNNIASKKAIKWVAKAYGVYDDEIDSYTSMYGDIGEGVYFFDGSGDESNISIKQLEALLTLDCSKIGGTAFNSFEEFFLKMSALEKKWFLRFWLRKTRNGMKTSSVVKALSQIYNKDLKSVERDVQFNTVSEVVQFYEEGESPETSLIVGNYIKPMLAKGLPKVKWPKTNYVVDYKYDGNRYQIHRKDDRVIIFNRKGKDTTDQYPDIVEEVLKVPVNEFIVDGEIYPIKEDGSPEKHQKLGTRVHSKNKLEAVEKCPVKLVVFDVLQMGGKSFMDETLQVRLNEWPEEYPFQTHRMWSKDSETGVMAFYHSAIQDGFEGIIIKPLDAKWQSGKRSKDWIKYKPPLIELDVVIIGGRYGDGKRANVFGSFDIAVKNGTDFTQIGCVGSGFSDEELLRLTRELRKLITESNGENFTFLPRIVLEVTGDVVTQNDDGTYALRFPRCKRIRDDKPVADVNTYEDMVNKYG